MRDECGERIVGIDQSEQERNSGGTIVGETSAIDRNAIETTAITLHGIGRIDEEGSLVKTLNLTRQTRRLFVGSATGESEERKTKGEKREFHDHLVDNNLHTNGNAATVERALWQKTKNAAIESYRNADRSCVPVESYDRIMLSD